MRRPISILVRWLALGGLLVVLASCATPGRIGGSGPAFERAGRFAVNLQPTQGAAQAVQGGYAWRDDGQRLLLDLTTPLGNVLARVDVQPGGASLQQSNGQHDEAPGPDDLVALVWGHPMPVSGLRDWFQGRIMAGAPVSALEKDAQGRPQSFMQQGWQVRLQDWDAQGPRRVRLLRQDDQGRWQLQLIVDESD